MDTLTHALSGMLLARATAPAAPRADQLDMRSRLLAGFLAAAFPDSDVVIRLFSDPLTYLNLHRGVTHSLPLLPLWAVPLSFVFALLWRRRYPWHAFYGVTLASLFMHVCGDVITAYGTMVLAPFSDYQMALPAIFIIDPWFSAIIVAGLLAAWGWRSRVPAVAGLVLLTGYVALQTWQMEQTRSLGAELAAARGIAAVEVIALPQPLSPFNWKIIVRDAGGFHAADVNMRRRAAAPETTGTAGFFVRLAALYRPRDDLRWNYYPQFGSGDERTAVARAAWQAEALAGMRRFAWYPALHALELRAAGACAWFSDLRFELRSIRNPFVFGACRDGVDGAWRLDRLEG